MHRHRPLLAALASSCLFTSVAAGQAGPRLFDLGDPFPRKVILADLGRTTYTNAAFGSAVERMDHDVGTTAIQLTGTGEFELVGVDSSGDRLLYTRRPSFSQTNLWRAAVRDASGQTTELGFQGPGFFGSRAVAISGDGGTVIGMRVNSFGEEEPCIWDAQGAAQLLGSLPGGTTFGRTLSVSDDGSVVVGESVVSQDCTFTPCSNVFESFIWRPATGMQPFSSLALNGWATAVSGDGQVVVGFESNPTPSGIQAIRHVLGQGTQQLVPGSVESFATDVSRDGSVIVGRVTNGAVIGRPDHTGWFLWREGVGAFAVRDVLGQIGAPLGPDRRVLRIEDLDGAGDVLLFQEAPAFGPGPLVRAIAIVGEIDLPIGTSECGPAANNSTGQAGTLAMNGYGFSGGPGFQLEASGLPPTALCLFLASLDAGSVPNPAGSQGTLCLGGAIGRFSGPGEFQTVDGAGTARLSVDAQSIPQPMARVGIQAGQTWRFQAWYRDANPGPASNFTSAVRETFE